MHTDAGDDDRSQDARKPELARNPEPECAIDETALEALAELAEAEAEEAEARAQLARARARAVRLRSAAARISIEDGASASAFEGGDVREVLAVGHDDDATETDAETTTTALDESEVEQSGISAKPVRFSRRRPRWRLLAVAAGVLGTCGFVAVTAVMFWQHHKVEAEHARDAAFVAAARHDVEMMLSIDYSKAKEDVQRIIDNSTGKFREDFSKNAKDFIEEAEKAKAVSQVSVSAAALQSSSANSATVLVSVASKVSNANGAKQDPRAWRMRVTVDRDGNQLKLSNVEFIP